MAHRERALLLSGLLAACAPDDRGGQAARGDAVAPLAAAEPRRAAEDTSYRLRPGYVVDSAVPRDELLRRFRGGSVRPAALAGGAPSRAALVRRFSAALADGDSAALRALLVTRAEWAWLVFPESPLSRPPYGQRPDAAWLLLSAGSDKAMQRLAERGSGGRLHLVGHTCPAPPAAEGPNRIWRRCTARVERPDGTQRTIRLFGPILERDGRFKFLSYENDL